MDQICGSRDAPHITLKIIEAYLLLYSSTFELLTEALVTFAETNQTKTLFFAGNLLLDWKLFQPKTYP